jgi:proteasome lid subunit RPN8/RPN11
VIDENILAALFAHALETYPEECCGLIRASGKVRRCENYQNALHAEDPATFPRDARRAFHLAPLDQLHLAQSFDTNDPVHIIYHSHPSGGTHFSDHDRAGALFEGRPIYPGLLHLVLDCRDQHRQGAALYEWQDGDFRIIDKW